jgi:hypothetical protein
MLFNLSSVPRWVIERQKLKTIIRGGTQVTDEVKAYCMKCKAERTMNNVTVVTMKNGRPAANGTCPVCGTKMFKFLPANKKPANVEASSAETPPASEPTPAVESAPNSEQS